VVQILLVAKKRLEQQGYARTLLARRKALVTRRHRAARVTHRYVVVAKTCLMAALHVPRNSLCVVKGPHGSQGGTQVLISYRVILITPLMAGPKLSEDCCLTLRYIAVRKVEAH